MPKGCGDQQPGEGEAQAVGRVIDPSCFAPWRERASERREGDLHVCPACASGLVHPVTWEPAARRRWRVSLRCPECEWNGAGTFGQRAVDRLDEALDRGTETMLDDLRTLVRANMEDEIDRFAAALAHDQLLPEDF